MLLVEVHQPLETKLYLEADFFEVNHKKPYAYKLKVIGTKASMLWKLMEQPLKKFANLRWMVSQIKESVYIMVICRKEGPSKAGRIPYDLRAHQRTSNCYLYVTEWDNTSGNSYVYRVSKKLSTIVKEKGKESEIISSVERIVTLDKRHLLEAAGVSSKAVKLEIESIDFLDGYLYFTANANYEDATKAHKQHSLDGLYKVKKRLA